MKKLLSLLVCALMLSTPIMADSGSITVPATEENEYALCVMDFMKLSNTKQTFSSTLAANYVQMKDQLQLSEQECIEMAEGMTDCIYADLVKLAIPIYEKYYTLEDMRTLCDFMRTPTGQKFAKSSANVSVEIMSSVMTLQDKMQEFVVKFMEKKKGIK